MNEFKKFSINHLGIDERVIDQYENSLTPYIIEERERRMTQMDIFSRLMLDRIIWIAGPINDNVSTIVQAQLYFYRI